jgi:hypothetical protein
MSENIFNDENIRKDIIQKLKKEKNLEEKIKYDLLDLKNWFEIECRVIEEKRRILKKSYDKLRIQKSIKEKELWHSYGANNVAKVKRKYNIGL